MILEKRRTDLHSIGYAFAYSVSRVLWSIYFVLCIGLIGLVLGYGVTVPLFLVSFVLEPVPKISTPIRYFAEYVQCFSIRLLLRLQPWLICHHNFQSIYGFYDKYQTRKIMFVANHRSNLDTFLLISLIPGLRGLAKGSLFRNILFAPIMIVIGFVPIRKGSLKDFVNGLKLLKTKILDQNRSLLIFPETTRCEKNFPSIQKFASSVFDPAVESEALVVPIYLGDTDQLYGRGDLFLNPFQTVSIKIFEAIPTANFANSMQLSKHVHALLLEQHEQFSNKRQQPLCS